MNHSPREGAVSAAPTAEAIKAGIAFQAPPPPPDLFGEPLPLTPAGDLIETLLARGLNRTGVASAAGVHPSQITRILKGEQTASAETHRKLLALVADDHPTPAHECHRQGRKADEALMIPKNETPVVASDRGEKVNQKQAIDAANDSTAGVEPPTVVALADSVTGPVTETRRGTWSDLSALLGHVREGGKDGQLWIAGDHAPGPRGNEHVKTVSVLALDIEAKTKTLDGIKTAVGPEPPLFADMLAEIQLVGWRCIAHTSYSHLDPAIHPVDVAHQRYRLVFALSRPLAPAELDPLGRHVAGLLGVADCFDPALLKPSQPIFLPRCPADRLALFQHASIDGEPLDVDVLLTDARRIREALRQASQQRQGPKLTGVIDAFNAAHPDIGAILREHGYRAKGRGRWLHPESSTGLPGVRQLPDTDPPRIFSSHGCCPLNDGHAHDAFDCWRVFAHQGDMTVAVREAARLLGLEQAKPQTEHRAPPEPPPDVQDEAAHWPEPEPLRAPLPAAEPYPVDSLGPWLAPAVKALHETVKAPIALCAQSVLAAASFAAQAHFDAAMPWGEVKPLSLAMLTIGESGERKSGVDDLVLGAAKLQQEQEMEAYKSETENYEAELAAWKSANEQAKKRASAKDKGKFEDFRRAAEEVGPAPLAPVLPLRFVSDPTVEGLFKLLAQGQPSVALFSDEGGLLIGGHALNNDNALKTLARWCKLWDGAPYDRVRGGDGSGILYGRRMALHQLAQPEVMTTLLNDGIANGQGFLARCLVAWPQSTIGTRHVERYEWGGERPEIKRLFGRLKGLFETPPRTKDPRGQVLDPAPLRLTREAEGMAIAANNQFETLMAPNGPLCEIRDRASKAMDNAIRIAGTLAVMDHGTAAKVIEVEHLQRGLELIQWYLAEALRIRGAAAIPQAVSDAELLLAWLKKRELRLFRSRDVLNAGPAPLRNKPRFMAAVEELVKNGYAVENTPGKLVDGVKTRLSWLVNADVL